ncbi:hypothetical protein AB1N83_013231, partial [Pleurotus pulmonarius]
EGLVAHPRTTQNHLPDVADQLSARCHAAHHDHPMVPRGLKGEVGRTAE